MASAWAAACGACTSDHSLELTVCNGGDAVVTAVRLATPNRATRVADAIGVMRNIAADACTSVLVRDPGAGDALVLEIERGGRREAVWSRADSSDPTDTVLFFLVGRARNACLVRTAASRTGLESCWRAPERRR